MVIGIVSDSHGKSKRLQTAVEIFARRNVDAVVHCGDIASAGDVEILASIGCATYLVLGNMDRRIEGLIDAAKHWSVHFHAEAVEVPLGEGEFLVATHGNDPSLLQDLMDDPQFPYVCHGHSHATCDERIGITRVINPGALHHIHPRTVAILDTDADKVEFIEVED
jgi:hypothetical protein